MKEYKHIMINGFDFPCEITKSGKPGKLEKDLVIVKEIFDKGIENISGADRLMLLNIYNVAYHESGKIEGIFSLDSSASNCAFCQQLRKYAADHPEKDIVCRRCYDIQQESYKVNALARHTLNMMIMQSIEFSIDELRYLPGGIFTRVNSSGDAPNVVYAENMIKYAYAHKDFRVTIWSKNTAAYVKACDRYGKPANVILIQSSLYINKPCALAKYFDYSFTVYTDESAVNAALAAGACECNGKKCKACGFKCYTGAWKSGANIAELLR